MEIENNSYKLSYDEANVVLAGTAILEKIDPEVLSVMSLIADSVKASRDLTRARLRYRDNEAPDEEKLDDACRSLESIVITLPKDSLTKKLLPIAVEEYFWKGHELKGLFSPERLAAASNMMAQLLCDTTDIN